MATLYLDNLERLGFAEVPDLLSEELRWKLLELFEGGLQGAGRRDALAQEAVREAARSPLIRDFVYGFLGPDAFAIKATLFDKSTDFNWLVPWHQDVMIPVRERRDVPGFEAWSEKGGVSFVRPPAPILESVVAVRLDLDGTNVENGPLRVIPGTHRRGFLDPDQVQSAVQSKASVACLIPEAGALFMRPLLLHASSKAIPPTNRRIVHIEFATGDLPRGLEWFEKFELA